MLNAFVRTPRFRENLRPDPPPGGGEGEENRRLHNRKNEPEFTFWIT